MRHLIVLILSVSIAAAGQAAETPARYPRTALHEGPVDLIDRHQHSLAIGDRLFYYTSATRFYRPDGISTSVDDLHNGQWAGCNYEENGEQRTLTEVWILPHDARF